LATSEIPPGETPASAPTPVLRRVVFFSVSTPIHVKAFSIAAAAAAGPPVFADAFLNVVQSRFHQHDEQVQRIEEARIQLGLRI
jgi:hypothetical protein